MSDSVEQARYSQNHLSIIIETNTIWENVWNITRKVSFVFPLNTQRYLRGFESKLKMCVFQIQLKCEANLGGILNV